MVDKCIEQFKPLCTGFISDAMSTLSINGWLSDLHPANKEHVICGRAFTIQFSDDVKQYPSSYNIFELLEKAEPGDIIVLSANSSGSACGEKVMRAAEKLGLQAIVTDGPTRDHRTLDHMQIPIFSAGATNRVRTTDFVPRAFQIPVYCAGVRIDPGDIIVGDTDGVISIPAEKVELIHAQTEWVRHVEDQMDAILSEGYCAEQLKILSKLKRQIRTAAR